MSSSRTKIVTFTAIVCAATAVIVLAKVQGPRLSPTYQLVLVDREGKRTPVGPLPPTTFAPRISPDGREVVFDTSSDGNVWIAKLSDFASKRLVITGGSNRGPMWSGDGTHILYITDHEGAETMFWKPADGSGSAELLVKPARAPESWAPREAGFSYITLKDRGDYDVWTYSMAGKRSTAFAALPGSPQHSSHYSPDGRWIAYVSGETGQLEVYVKAASGAGPAVRVSTAGGGHPLWSPDQRELFFDNNNQMFVAAIQTSPGFTATKPVALAINGFVQGPLRRQYDLMPDGKQFLMIFPAI
jgi:eukaryotic-like serine/threonine-protein kinase